MNRPMIFLEPDFKESLLPRPDFSGLFGASLRLPVLASDLRDESSLVRTSAEGYSVETSYATGESCTSTDTSVSVAEMEVRDLFLWMT